MLFRKKTCENTNEPKKKNLWNLISQTLDFSKLVIIQTKSCSPQWNTTFLPWISLNPNFLNQFLFPLEVQKIGISLPGKGGGGYSLVRVHIQGIDFITLSKTENIFLANVLSRVSKIGILS